MRYFKHDLEDGLRAFHDDPDLTLSDSQASDSLFLEYSNRRLVVSALADTLWPTIVTSGEEDGIWWYELLYRAPASIESLSVQNSSLFDLFDDQKNIFQVLFLPEGRRETLFFVAGADRYELGA